MKSLPKLCSKSVLKSTLAVLVKNLNGASFEVEIVVDTTVVTVPNSQSKQTNFSSSGVSRGELKKKTSH